MGDPERTSLDLGESNVLDMPARQEGRRFVCEQLSALPDSLLELDLRRGRAGGHKSISRSAPCWPSAASDNMRRTDLG